MAAAFREMFDEKEYRLIDENKGTDVSEAINKAVEDFKEHSSDTQMLSLDCYGIMLLLSDQSNHTHDNDDQSYVRFIKPVIDAIEESYMDDISARELADGVFVSQQYLSRVFTEFMNCSVYEYLTNYRINKAKELLLINSRRKVQDIASDVGTQMPAILSSCSGNLQGWHRRSFGSCIYKRMQLFLVLIGFDVKIYLSEIWCENEYRSFSDGSELWDDIASGKK